MKQDFRALLLADAAVAGLVGVRAYWSARPQGSDLPAIVFHLISTVTDYTMRGPVGLVGRRVQVDCYADGQAGIEALSRAVEARLSGFRGVFGATDFQGIFLAGVREEREAGSNDAERFFRASLDFTVHSMEV